MGAVVGAIVGAIGSVIGAVVDAVSTIVGAVFDVALKYIIEPVMNFLGFKDEDIYIVNVISTKVYDEDQYPKMRTKLAIDKLKNQTTSIDYLKGFLKVGEAQFSKYFYKGKYDYLDYLPESQFQAVSIPSTKIKEILEDIEGDKVFIVDILGMVPSDDDWCKYQLQELYNYNIGNDILEYNNKYYQYNNTKYNINNNIFTVTMSLIDEVSYIVYETISTTIEPYDDINDKKTTTTIKETNYYKVNDGTFLFNEINDTNTVITYVPKDSETSTISVNTIDTGIKTYNKEEITFTIKNHNNIRKYVVKYTINSRLKYWIYDPTSNEYPSIASPVQEVVDFEMYPVVMLRNNYFNIADYEKSVIEGTPRPSTVTEERYEDTVDILNGIGISLDDITKAYSENSDIGKLQDAFFLLGVSPSDTDYIVSKVLFEMFDFVYDTLPVAEESKAYAAVFKENPYNAVLSWTPSSPYFLDEKIGSLGFYKHEITNDTIITVTKEVTVVKVYSKNKAFKEVNTYKLEEIKTSTGRVISSKVSNNKIEIISDPYNRLEVGKKEIELSSKSQTTKGLELKKQVEFNKTKVLTLYNVTSLSIIRHSGGNGGVTLDLNSKDLVIPLAVDAVARLTITDKTQLLDNAVYMQFYAVQHIHLKWYETAAFANFLKIISIGLTIVVSIVSFGSMTTGAITLTSALWAVAETVAIGVALTLAIELINIVFKDSAFLRIAFTVLATATAMYIGGAFDEFNWIDVTGLLNSAVDAANTFLNEKLALDFNALNSDIEAFSKVYEDKLNLFEDIFKQLDSGLTVEDIVDINITNVSNNKTVSPDMFYYLANEAYLNTDMLFDITNNISNFVDNKLRLDTGE